MENIIIKNDNPWLQKTARGIFLCKEGKRRFSAIAGAINGAPTDVLNRVFGRDKSRPYRYVVACL